MVYSTIGRRQPDGFCVIRPEEQNVGTDAVCDVCGRLAAVLRFSASRRVPSRWKMDAGRQPRIGPAIRCPCHLEANHLEMRQLSLQNVDLTEEKAQNVILVTVLAFWIGSCRAYEPVVVFTVAL
jgi:hypothetical protein